MACHRFGLADNRRLRKRMIERSASSARPKRWQATALQDLLLCPVNRMEDAKLMNHVERFRAVMNGQPVDRLPRWEWAMWWDETIARWKREGLPEALESVFDIAQYFGLDPYQQFWFSTTDATIDAVQHHVEGIVSNMDDYLRIRPRSSPMNTQAIEAMRPWTGARPAATRCCGSPWKVISGSRGP